MERYRLNYFAEMSDQTPKNIRVSMPPELRRKMDQAFTESKISQIDGVHALIQFFVDLDDVGRAMMLGQLKPARRSACALDK